jgi:hypothetical protein
VRVESERKSRQGSSSRLGQSARLPCLQHSSDRLHHFRKTTRRLLPAASYLLNCQHAVQSAHHHAGKIPAATQFSASIYSRNFIVGTLIPIYSRQSANFTPVLQETYLFQIPRLQRIRLRRVVRILRAEIVHLANLPASSARHMVFEILDSGLLVARLHACDFAEDSDPVWPGEPLACSHERGARLEFGQCQDPSTCVFRWIEMGDENVWRGGELHLYRAVGLLVELLVQVWE